MNPGTQLGSYEILSPLGKGGMGEVWRARDTKLGREVAIKTLPEEFAQDEERLARFEREAKLLASLNHPNIAAIYGLEEDNGTRFLVLELVEGDTLAERLKRGAIPVEESLKLALQIAEALEPAHEKGVIHRDLKPANIKVTPEGKIKVLDFGLAKAFAGDGSGVNLSNSPTLSMQATQQGVILGTAAYMSPEQARGQEVDKRADVWAFGVVLFEMLTGRGTFDGGTVSDVLAGVLRADPDWKGLPPHLHPRIQFLLERCLEKESKDRYGDISDARVDIEKVLADPDGVIIQSVAEGVQAAPRSLLPSIAVAVLSAVVGGALVWNLRPAGPPSQPLVTRFPVTLPDTDLIREGLAFSPSGDRFVYTAQRAGAPRQLFARARDQVEAVPILGTEGAAHPFFSPNGESVGFFTGTELRRVSLAGGPTTPITTVAFRRGATWGPNNMIVFASEAAPGLMQVSAAGGEPRTLTTPQNENERHQWPEFLPNGNAVLFTTIFPMGEDGSVVSDAQVFVLSLDTEEYKFLVDGTDATYAHSGHLVFGREDSLWAVPFDLDRLELTGEPSPIMLGVQVNTGGWAQYALAGDGSLAYLSVGGLDPVQNTLVWIDRRGTVTPVFNERRAYGRPRISPDGERIAMTVSDADSIDVWIYDVRTGTGSQLTDDEKNKVNALWTPDGDRITFRYGSDIYWQPADASGPPELLWDGENSVTPYSWSQDGNFLAFGTYHPDTLNDIWVLSVEDGTAEPFRNTDISEVGGAFSPDGKWISYSQRVGDQEPQVWVAPYPGPGIPHQISTDGGVGWSQWSADGRTLFFRGGEGARHILAASIQTEPVFSRRDPESVVEVDGRFITPNLHPDGERFATTLIGNTSQAPINIVLNWFEELKQRVPVP